MELLLGNILGGVGVTLLVTAFILNAMGWMSVSYAYILLNLVGAGLAAVASLLIGFIPFLVLETIWFLAAGLKLVSLYRSGEAVAVRTTGADR